MYFPILRGKQNELLALRELLEDGKLSNEILPVIEPVTPSSTFKSLLLNFNSKNRSIAIIQNPEVTHYDEFDDEEVKSLKASDNFVPALIVNNNDDWNFSQYTNPSKLIILDEKSEFDNSSLVDDKTYAIVEVSNRSVLRILNGSSKLVEMHDQFLKQERNADYLNKEDELFSSEHRYFKQDGFYGFSDYSIIGHEYQTSGFAAKAVVIHLVYLDDKDDLRIHHFVSDSNDDIKNPALKAHEALKKLVEFVSNASFDNVKNHSEALKEFIRLYELDKYPGLGYFKKLSLKHHFEILGRFLEK